LHDISDLGAFFKPKSVAVVGASADPKKPGNTVLRNMISMGYQGRIFPVNPREETVLGLPCYRNLLDIPEPVEMCVFIVSPELTLQFARELAERKARFNDVVAAVCMSGGFGELNNDEGKQREKELVEILNSASIRLVGPNCLGIIDTESGFNTNFDIETYPKGGVSFLTQSGAFGASFLMWAKAGGLVGLNKFVSIGNTADVSMAEFLMFWKNDPSTRVIGIYMEGLADPRGFFEVAREVTAVKPIVVLKSGKSEVGSAAALSHTGAVAGADAIYDGAFRQAGIVRAGSVSEFYDTMRAFAKQPVPAGGRICVLTHMGGPGTICIDEIAAQPALRMTAFSPETESALREIVAPAACIGRPDGYIDLTAAHHEKMHNQVLRTLFRDENIDMVLQILAPSGFLNEKLLAAEIASAYDSQPEPRKPLLNVVTFGYSAQDLRRGLEESSLPTVEYPDNVAKVAGNLAFLAAYRRGVAARAAERPGAQGRTGHGPAAAELIAAAVGEGRVSLLETEAYEVCSQYGIQSPPFRVTDTVAGAISGANEIGYPVVLKVVSAEILHKSDVGGVILGVDSDRVLEQSYGKLVENITRVAPHLKRPIVLVQKMLPTSTELILGALRDPAFGPVVMVGLGGIFVEAMRLVGFRLAPLDIEEAKQLIHETIPEALLRGTRGRPKMDVDAIANALVSLGRLLEEQPLVEQVDLNPVLPHEAGCTAVDARIIISTKS
jgi:acetate---CoA ligase (ADP-forming)